MPLVSVVIPTCNRADYLLKTIDSVLDNVVDVEIVVSDNSDTNALEGLLKSYVTDGSVKYNYISNPISVVDNFEKAIAIAKGEYIICLGDDDSVGPGFNDVVNWMKENNIDAAYSYGERFIANYFWPGVNSKYFGSGYEAKLFIRPYTGKALKINGKAALKSAARNLGCGLGAMPRIYHGIVNRSLINAIREKYGSVFGGVSPDIYSATLISLEAQNIYSIDAPFVIPGASPISTAGQGAAQTDRSRLFDVDHIRRFGSELKWSQYVPAYYGPFNVWAYSMLCALNTAAPTIKPNYMRVILKSGFGGLRYKNEVLTALKIVFRDKGIFSSSIYLLSAAFAEAQSVLKRFYWKYFIGMSSHENLNTIGDAVTELKLYEKNKNFQLRLILKEQAR